jgi:glyoxalase family protein
MKLCGFHHVTAVTSNAKVNLDFYTRILGLRLVKKTVNQDDVSAYHLFYADNEGTPGTDITFFDWNASPEKRGTDSIVRTGYRVSNFAALEYWRDRLSRYQVSASDIFQRDEHSVIDFEDPEGQRLMLIADDKSPNGVPRDGTDIPSEYQLQGLGPVMIRVSDLDGVSKILEAVLNFEKKRTYQLSSEVTEMPVTVFSMEGMGTHAELHVMHDPDAPKARLGAGGIHHIAFRIPTFDQYDSWAKRLMELRIPNSGPIDRFYFKSLYFREPNGILFELATDEPGFASDESVESLGQHLALPPFLEERRAEIEAGLKPL